MDAAPAWIQAIGSVLAIVAAAYIARGQIRSAAKLEDQKQAAVERKRLEIIKALMVRAYGLSNDICRAFETLKHEDFDQVSPLLMIDTRDALKNLPIFEVPNGLLALDVLSISHGMSELREGWVKLLEALKLEQPIESEIEQLVILAREVRTISQEAMKACDQEISERSTKPSTD